MKQKTLRERAIALQEKMVGQDKSIEAFRVYYGYTPQEINAMLEYINKLAGLDN